MNKKRVHKEKNRAVPWENAFREFLNASDEGFFIIDSAGRFREANGAYCRMTGCSREELLEKGLEEMNGVDTAKAVRDRIEAILGSGTLRYLTSHRRKNGGIIDVEISATSYTTDDGTYILAFVRNIEDRNDKIWRELTRGSLLELFAKETSRKEYLESVVELLGSWSGFRHICVRLIDENGCMPCEASAGSDDAMLHDADIIPPDVHQYACDQTAADAVEFNEFGNITSEGAFYCNDAQSFIRGLSEEDRWRYSGACGNEKFKSIIVIPLRHLEKTIGVVHLADERDGKSSPGVVDFIQSIAPIISEAVNRFNVEQELSNNYDTQRIINSLLNLAFEGEPVEVILQRSMDLIFTMPWLREDRKGCIYLIEDQPSVLALKAHRGFSGEEIVKYARVPFARCICKESLDHGAVPAVSFGNVEEAGECLTELLEGSYCVPIATAERMLGVISINRLRRRSYTGTEEFYFTAIAQTLALVIQKKEKDREITMERHKLESVLNSMNDGVIIVNRECGVDYVNPVMARDFGPVEGRKCHEYIEDKNELCDWCEWPVEARGVPGHREWYCIKNGRTYELYSTEVESIDGGNSKVEFFHDVTSQKVADREISHQADMLAQVSDAIISFNEGMVITYWNDAAEIIFGWTSAEAVGQPVMNMLGEMFSGTEFAATGSLSDIPENFRNELVLKRKDGNMIHVETTGIRFRGVDGTVNGYVTVNRDITRRKFDEAEMTKLMLAVEQASDWVIITDRDGTVEYTNSIVEKITGYGKSEIIGRKPNMFKSGKHDGAFYKNLWDTVNSGGTFRSIFINMKKNGDLFYIDNTITPLKNIHGEITHFIASGKDITQQMHMEDRLITLVYYDLLTGLPNRTLFMDRLNQVMTRAEYQKRLIAVIILDLDRFKYLNDVFGSNTGDEVLKEVSVRLQNCIRDGDILARLGGDEFGLALVDVAQKEDFIVIVEKIRTSVSEPILVKGNELVLTVSIGISLYPFDGENAHAIFQNADIAFSKAKMLGRNNYQYYTSDMNEKASEFMFFEKQLFSALDNDEFVIHYQPYYDIYTKKMVGMESLLRWDNKSMGLALPQTFIPILEETGMINPVGYWIMRKICGQLIKWRGEGLPVVPVSINISPIQFRQKDLADTLEKIVAENRVDPSLIVLEIIESTLMHDFEYAGSVLKKLREIGFSISIDDFGTGYSSLSYLKRFPIDSIKIDKSFINDITTDPDSGSIVTAIISLSHSLNLKVIAEGVETEEQLNILRILRCDFIQGFYYSRPLTSEAIEHIYVASMVANEKPEGPVDD